VGGKHFSREQGSGHREQGKNYVINTSINYVILWIKGIPAGPGFDSQQCSVAFVVR